MPSLAETQGSFAAALLRGECGTLAGSIVGGPDPRTRLAIHVRHYEASLSAALAAKFPGLSWLVGDRLFADTARAFLRMQPPARPCIAEYGHDFPAYLAARPELVERGFVESFGRLEWAVGQAAIALVRPSLSRSSIATVALDSLPDLRFSLQSGLSYLVADWPVDQLLQHFIADDAPDRFEMTLESIHIEVSGGRGTFAFRRLDRPTWLFRAALRRGEPVGVAAEAALEGSPGFDPGAAFAAVFDDGLVVDVKPAPDGGRNEG